LIKTEVFFMTEEFKKQIETEARQAVTELLAEAKLKKGDVFVVGCSSSEIVGGHIGKDSSLEAAQAVYAGIAPVLAQRGMPRRAPELWMADSGCGYLLQCSPELWMRDGIVEVSDIIPFGYLDEEEGK